MIAYEKPGKKYGNECWKRFAGQQGIAYAKTVAEAMNLKLDIYNLVDREKLRLSQPFHGYATSGICHDTLPRLISFSLGVT